MHTRTRRHAPCRLITRGGMALMAVKASGPAVTSVGQAKSPFRISAWMPVVRSTTCDTSKSVAALR